MFDDGSELVFKSASWHRSLEMEALAHEAARAVGVRVPQVHALDTSCSVYPQGFVLMQKIEGTRLSAVRGDRGGTLQDLGQQLRRFHEIPLDGYGMLASVAGEPLRGETQSWRATLEAILMRTLPPLEQQGLAPRGSLSLARELLDGLPEPQQPSLLHGDFTPYHVFVADDGSVSGIIDPFPFGGDPCWEAVGFTLVGGEDALSPLLRGYGADEGFLDDLRTRGPFYRLAQAISSAYWAHARGADASALLRALPALAERAWDGARP